MVEILPVYKIETYTGETLDYTITSDADVVRASDFLTSEVGTFSFTLPTKKEGSYVYNDIAVDDTAKIWFGYDTVSTDPFTVGKILHISAPLQTEQGFVRIFTGLNHGEVLQRRLKTKYWTDVHADTIIAELASDLGLGTVFTGDASDDYHVTLHEEDKKYWDIVKALSDYWVSAGVAISKDFYVDIGDVGHPLGHLVWKTRPFRQTPNVEALTVGDNILSYNVVKSLASVNNNITVYGESGKIGVPGADGRKEPSNGDLWTIDAVGNWIQVHGTISVSAPANAKVGSNALECECEADTYLIEFRRNITVPFLGKEKYQTYNFWIDKYFGGTETLDVRLFAPDASNYFTTTINVTSAYVFHQMKLGESEEYDVDKNPTGIWHKVGSPSWHYLPTIGFSGTFGSQDIVWLDGLYFGHGRFRKTVSDATYDQRDLVIVDDALHSDAECESRGNMLLSTMKDSTIQLELTLKGNTNVKIGDRIPITIPAENITAVDFDVLNVEHIISNAGFYTKAVLNSNEKQRDKIPNTPLEMLKRSTRDVQRLLKMQEKTYAP